MTSAEKKKLIASVAEEVKQKFEHEGSGHDWWHIYRVWKMAARIGRKESADMLLVELGALLHDIADWKFHNGDDSVGPRVASEMLAARGVTPEIISKVALIISQVSFKGAGVKTKPSTLEGMIVQDADRLDAIGAIGIARTFAFSGHMNRPMHVPGLKPVFHKTKESYKKSTTSTINHFYEKLLLLKGLMNTKEAKKIAADRHAFMQEYLKRFFSEWEGKS